MTAASPSSGTARAIGTVYSWWKGDLLPSVPTVGGFSAARANDVHHLARLNALSVEEVQRRLLEENVPYLGTCHDIPVCYGWSAHRRGHIGALDLTLVMPERNRYLWDFATLPEWRGRGLYPLLLRYLVSTEAQEAQRFWIGHDAENVASGRGILRAGFQPAAEMWTDGSASWFVPLGALPRAEAAAELFGLPLRVEG